MSKQNMNPSRRSSQTQTHQPLAIVHFLSRFLYLSESIKPLKYISLIYSEFEILGIIIYSTIFYRGATSRDSFIGFVEQLAKFATAERATPLKDSFREARYFMYMIFYTLFLFILVGVAVFFSGYYRKSQWNNRINKIIKTVAIVYPQILFLVISQFSLNLIIPQYYEVYQTKMVSRIIGGLSLCLLFFIALLFSYVAKEPYQISTGIASPNSAKQVYDLLIKFSYVLVLRADLDLENKKWMLAFIISFLLILRMISCFRAWPYYSFKLNKVINSINVMHVTLVILQFIFAIASFNMRLYGYFLLLIPIFGLKLGMVISEKQLLYYQSLNLKEKLHSKSDILKQFISIQHAIIYGIEEYKLNKKVSFSNQRIIYTKLKQVIYNNLQREILESTNQGKIRSSQKIPSKVVISDQYDVNEDQPDDPTTLFWMLRSLYTQAWSNQMPEHQGFIQLILSYHLLGNFDTSQIVPIIIMSIKKKREAFEFEQQAAKLSLSELIEQKFTEKIQYFKENQYLFKEAIDIQTIYTMDTMKAKLDKLMKENTIRYIEYWNYFASADCKAKDILQQSIVINQVSRQIKKMGHQLSILTSNQFYSLELCLYLATVGNEPFTSGRLLEISVKNLLRKRSIQNDIINYQNIDSETDFFVYFDPINLAIKNYSPNCQELFDLNQNYNKYTIEQLLPSFYDRYIQDYKQNCMQISDNLILYQNHDIYIQNKDGRLQPSKINLSIVPSLSDGPQILAIIRLQVPISPEQLIVLSPDGLIQGFTTDIGELLSLPNDKRKIALHELCLQAKSQINKIIADILPENNQEKLQDQKFTALNMSTKKRKSIFIPVARQYSQQRTNFSPDHVVTSKQLASQGYINSFNNIVEEYEPDESNNVILHKYKYSHEMLGKYKIKGEYDENFDKIFLKLLPIDMPLKNSFDSQTSSSNSQSSQSPSNFQKSESQHISSQQNSSQNDVNPFNIRNSEEFEEVQEMDNHKIMTTHRMYSKERDEGILSSSRGLFSTRFSMLDSMRSNDQNQGQSQYLSKQKSVRIEQSPTNQNTQKQSNINKISALKRFSKVAKKAVFLNRLITKEQKTLSFSKEGDLSVRENNRLKNRLLTMKFNPQDAMNDASSQTSSVAGRVNKREETLQKAIHSTYCERSLRLIQCFTLIYCTLATITTILYMVQSNNDIEQINSLLNIFELNENRSFRQLVIVWSAYSLQGVMKGYFEPTKLRFRIPVSFVSNIIPGFLDSSSKLLMESNQKIQQRMHILEPKTLSILQQRTIPIQHFPDLNDVTRMNLYEATNNQADATSKWSNINRGRPVVYQQSDLLIADYLIKNGQNQYLVETQQFFRHVYQDAQLKLDQVWLFAMVNGLWISGIGLVIFLSVLYLQINFAKKRMKMMEIITKITDLEIHDTIKPAQSLLNFLNLKYNKKLNLKYTNMDKAKSEFSKHENFERQQDIIAITNNSRNIYKTFVQEAAKGNSSAYTRKKMNYKGLNNQIQILEVILFGILMFTIGVSFMIFQIFQKGSNDIESNFNRLVQTNNIYLTYTSTIMGLEELLYSGETGTYLAVSIKDNWEKWYKELTSSAQFFSTFLPLTTNNGTEMKRVLTGNLCDDYLFSQTQCWSETQREGLIGVNSQMLNLMRKLKDQWDESPKDHAAFLRVYRDSDFILIENMFYYIQYNVFKRVLQLLRVMIVESVDSFQTNSRQLILIFSVCYLVIGYTVWLPVYLRYIYRDRKVLSNLWILIPAQLIVRNRYLKNHLIQNCQGKLDRIKQHL